jgi:hypothetical protein
MRKSAKLGVMALAAALMLATALNTASARNLSISTQNIRVTWEELSFQGTGFNVKCQITLEGSFHSRTIPKVTRLLIGAITRAIAYEERCTGGRLSLYAEPWHVTYEAFVGALPRIEAVQLLLSRFRFHAIIPLICPIAAEYGTAEDNITFRLFRETDGSISSVDPVSMRNIAHKAAGPAGCPAEGRLVGTLGLLTVLNTTTHVTITLI